MFSLLGRWLLNGTEVPLGSERHTLVAGNLVISSPEPSRDTGSYQCLVINRCGTIISRAANLKFGCERNLQLFSDHSRFINREMFGVEENDFALSVSIPFLLFTVIFLQTSMTSLLTVGVHRLHMRVWVPFWLVNPLHITQVLLQSSMSE